MTSRGRAVLALGLAVYVVAWIFGSRALYPVAAGLVLAVALAIAWVRLSLREPEVWRHGAGRDVVEGEDVRIDLVVHRTASVAPPTLVAEERLGRLGERTVELFPVRRRRHAGGYELRSVPRGRYGFQAVRLTVVDPFGLAAGSVTAEEPQALVVYPRLTELARLFFEGGSRQNDGRRLLLRRPAGFELHSVRDYEQGESLRRVHWPSTARRGRLMVKELEDAPRDEVAVLLDGDASAVVGEPPNSTFDVAVRAAGSILHAQARRGRRAVLALNTAGRETQTVGSEGGDWRRALELLAAAEPDARTPAFALLEASGGAAARSLELVVVTSRVEAPLVHRLVQRALSRRGVAVVYVEPESFAGRAARPQPELLRLQAAGVPVAVVRRGDDLAAALAPAATQEVARA
ncbi:MAG TPA: DUF58 domain-containing protein [Gaiellaceae bacterium]|nr:DUF58 domain-containing protein [Gaiellaceae bacterium]